MKKKPLSKELYRVVVRIIKARNKKKARAQRTTIPDAEFEKLITQL